MTSPWRQTPLREQAERRKLLSFLKAILSLLRSFNQSSESGSAARVGAKTFSLLETRVVHEIEWLREDHAQELRGVLVSVVIELLCVEDSRERARYLFEHWLGDAGKWKESAEGEIRRVVSLIN